MCAAIVQLYRMYYLYYLVICVSFNSCAVYLYYFASPTQILRVLAAPKQLVPATTSTTRRPSRANGGAPVPGPMVALPFWRVLTSVRPTPVPPIPPPVHMSHPASNQPKHKSQCFLIQPIRYDPIQPIQYNPDEDTIRYSQSSRHDNTIQPMIRYDPVSPLTRKSHSISILS